MSIDITKLILGILEVLVGATIIYLIPMIKKFLKEKLNDRQYELLSYFSEIFVNAAEQKFVGEKRGKEKYAYVINKLREKGFNVDESELDAYLEAAVKRLKDAA